MDPDVSGEEAAWRDLIARFDLPVDTATAQPPWPAREDLADEDSDLPLSDREPGDKRDTRDTTAGGDDAGPAGPQVPPRRAGPASLPGPGSLPGPSSLPGPASRPGQDGWGSAGQSGWGGTDEGGWSTTDWDAASEAGSTSQADTGGQATSGAAGTTNRPGISSQGSTENADGGTGTAGESRDDEDDAAQAAGDARSPEAAPPSDQPGGAGKAGWLGRTRSGSTGSGSTGSASAGNGGTGNGRAALSGFPGDRARIVRRIESVPRPTRAGGDQEDDDDDNSYVPQPPEPLPQLDPVAKGAWAGLLGGPAYLIVTTLLGRQFSDWAALVAISAFIAGFVTLVVRMSDRPRDDDDDGAVV